MSKAAEELLLKHERERDTAMAETKRLADRVVIAMAETRKLNTFVEIDFDDVRRNVEALADCQQRVIQTTASIKQVTRDALGV